MHSTCIHHIRRDTWSHHSSTTSLAVSPPPINMTRLLACSGTNDLSSELCRTSPTKSRSIECSRSRFGFCTLPVHMIRNLLVNCRPLSQRTRQSSSSFLTFITQWSRRMCDHNWKCHSRTSNTLAHHRVWKLANLFWHGKVGHFCHGRGGSCPCGLHNGYDFRILRIGPQASHIRAFFQCHNS